MSGSTEFSQQTHMEKIMWKWNMYSIYVLNLSSDLVDPHKETLSSTQQGVESDDNNFPLRETWAQSLQVHARWRWSRADAIRTAAEVAASDGTAFRWEEWQQAGNKEWAEHWRLK